MATIVPRRLQEKLTYFKTHLPAFQENAEAIGLTEAEVAELDALVAAAELARAKQGEAQVAAQAATAEANQAMDALATLGQSLIQKVRAQATLTDNEQVYTLACLPLPAKRSPIGKPGTPTNFSSSVDAVGQVTLKWDCENPKGAVGTTYHVSRQIAPGEPFVFIGISGQKKFVDSTIPKGVTSLVYEIRAIRSTAIGLSASFNVHFGSNGIPLPVPFAPANRHGPIQLAA